VNIQLTLKVLLTLAVLWHTFAFAAGGVYVFHAYQTLFKGGHSPLGTSVIRSADLQLWLSGVLIIGFGIVLAGFNPYVSNPKLWTKVLLITVWFISTQTMRFYAVAQFRAGIRLPMLLASSVNVACWIYGAFLGVAKPLAYGVVSFPVLAAGFVVMIALCLSITMMFETRRQQRHSI
jgi:chromate transporter